MLKARLHPRWTKAGYRYSVIFRGKLLVARSTDPECDAARALLARGITGKLTMLDGKTGRPRTVIDIERAAQLCVKEGPLRFAPYESRPDRSPTAEGNELDGKGGMTRLPTPGVGRNGTLHTPIPNPTRGELESRDAPLPQLVVFRNRSPASPSVFTTAAAATILLSHSSAHYNHNGGPSAKAGGDDISTRNILYLLALTLFFAGSVICVCRGWV